MFTFETQGTNTYLVYEILPEDKLDSLTLGMLKNNHINGVAQLLFTQMDDKQFLKYNVTSKVPVNQMFAGVVNRKRLLGVFDGICTAYLAADEYMIDTNTFILDLSYIFADVSTCSSSIICLPVTNRVEENKKELATFFKDIMFSTQFDQTESCDYVAAIINYLNSVTTFSLNDFKALLDTLKVPQNGMQRQTTAPHITPPVTPVQQVKPQPPVSNVGSYQSVTATQPMQGGRMDAPQQFTQPQAPKPKQPANPQPKQPQPAVQQLPPPEKKVSFMGLMMHYSKENKALYKETKEYKKNVKAVHAQEKNGQANMPTPPIKPQSGYQPYNQAAAKPEPPKQGGSQAVPFAIPGTAPTYPNPGQPIAQPAPQQIQKQVQQPAPQQGQKQVQQPAPTIATSRANFGETTILNVETAGETTVLGTGMKTSGTTPRAYLTRVKNNERIFIDRPLFKIGKEKSYVDYFISDNTAISRSHASIITRDGSYYLVDTNSTNHTFINGGMIQSNAEVRIDTGDRIRLANEEFIFTIA